MSKQPFPLYPPVKSVRNRQRARMRWYLRWMLGAVPLLVIVRGALLAVGAWPAWLPFSGMGLSGTGLMLMVLENRRRAAAPRLFVAGGLTTFATWWWIGIATSGPAEDVPDLRTVGLWGALLLVPLPLFGAAWLKERQSRRQPDPDPTRDDLRGPGQAS